MFPELPGPGDPESLNYKAFPSAWPLVLELGWLKDRGEAPERGKAEYRPLTLEIYGGVLFLPSTPLAPLAP